MARKQILSQESKSSIGIGIHISDMRIPFQVSIVIAAPRYLMLSTFFFLSLYTATRPRGHARQVDAASVSIRQKKLKYSKE